MERNFTKKTISEKLKSISQLNAIAETRQTRRQCCTTHTLQVKQFLLQSCEQTNTTHMIYNKENDFRITQKYFHGIFIWLIVLIIIYFPNLFLRLKTELHLSTENLYKPCRHLFSFMCRYRDGSVDGEICLFFMSFITN